MLRTLLGLRFKKLRKHPKASKNFDVLIKKRVRQKILEKNIEKVDAFIKWQSKIHWVKCKVFIDFIIESSERCDFSPAEGYCTWSTESFNAPLSASTFTPINFFENRTTLNNNNLLRHGTEDGAQGQ